MQRKSKKNQKTRNGIEKRLDALIRLFIELNKSDPKKKFREADAARILKSVDLTPTESAKILAPEKTVLLPEISPNAVRVAYHRFGRGDRKLRPKGKRK